MNILLLSLVLCASPPAKCEKAPEVSKPLKFTYGTDVSDKAKIYVETLFPKCDKCKWKILTKEEFRKQAKTIMYHEYRLIKMVIEKDEIVELHFRLPTPDEYKNQEPRREALDVASTAKP